METKRNYKNYRNALQSHRQGGVFALPYLGVYLRDLTFVEEGVQAKVEEQVNLEKVFLVANILDEIKAFQNRELKILNKYGPDENPTNYLKVLTGYSEEELEKMSKDREPLKIHNPIPATAKQALHASNGSGTPSPGSSTVDLFHSPKSEKSMDDKSDHSAN